LGMPWSRKSWSGREIRGLGFYAVPNPLHIP
jgi:hypothetical protein